MSKVVIDDAMVERAARSLSCNLSEDDARKKNMRQIRCALEAALNPPPEPEIVVTEEMHKAGVDVFVNAKGGNIICPIYRAMRRLEPKFGDSYASSPNVQRDEVDRSWPYGLPWFPRMAGPGAVIPVTDPRVRQRRAMDCGRGDVNGDPRVRERRK